MTGRRPMPASPRGAARAAVHAAVLGAVLGRVRGAVLGTVIAAVLVAGCGIPPDDSPRDITGAARRDLLANASAAGAATGAARIFLVVPGRPGGSGSLRAVPRDVDSTPAELLTALLAGPNQGEQRAQLTTAVPAGTRLNSARVLNGALNVDLAGAIDQLTGETLIEAVAQIVLTATEIPSIRSVRLLIDGVPSEWPDGAGQLQAAPLTRYDFPGLVESSQPDFPAVVAPVT